MACTLFLAAAVTCVSAATALQDPSRDAGQDARIDLPPALEAEIARHVADLDHADRALDACARLTALGPLAVPALTDVIAGYQGGVADRQLALGLYCLGVLGERGASAAPAILDAIDTARRTVAYGPSAAGQLYWALAHTAPFHRDVARIESRLEAMRGGAAVERAIARERLKFGPRPHALTIQQALAEVTPAAVAALYAINHGGVSGFDEVRLLRDLFAVASEGGATAGASSDLRDLCARECAVAWSMLSPDTLPRDAWWRCLDHHDPTVQRRAASYLVDASMEASSGQRRDLVRRLLAMHRDVVRAPLRRSLAWPNAERWVPALDREGLEAARASQPHLAFVIDPLLGASETPWTDDQRSAVAAAVASPFFALWQGDAVAELLGRLCAGTDPQRGLLAAVVEQLPQMAEGTLRACLAAVPVLVAREPAVVAQPAGDLFRARLVERLRDTDPAALHHCAGELASAWAAIQLSPGAAPGRCAHGLYDPVPAVRLRAAELLARATLEGGARRTIADHLRHVLTTTRLGLSYELPGLRSFPVDADLEDALRCAAAEGLTVHGEAEDVFAALNFLLDSGTSPQRCKAARALGKVLDHPRDRMVTLVHHLDDTDSAVAVAAAEALGGMGDVAREAIPDLEHELEDAEDPEVRSALAAALARLRRR